MILCTAETPILYEREKYYLLSIREHLNALLIRKYLPEKQLKWATVLDIYEVGLQELIVTNQSFWIRSYGHVDTFVHMLLQKLFQHHEFEKSRPPQYLFFMFIRFFCFYLVSKWRHHSLSFKFILLSSLFHSSIGKLIRSILFTKLFLNWKLLSINFSSDFGSSSHWSKEESRRIEPAARHCNSLFNQTIYVQSSARHIVFIIFSSFLFLFNCL